MAKEWDATFETFDELIAAEWNDHVTDQKNHSGRHENGGVDEISVSGLSGDLADPQDPKQEVVEDFVDTLLAEGNAISTTYDDANDTLTIDVIDGDVDHDSLNQFVANEHINHTNVNITAGNGLTGGGDISQDRTLNAHTVESISTNTTLDEVDIALVDASGGAVTVTLPAPNTNLITRIKKTDGSTNGVTIATPNSETIDGDNSRTITSQYISRTIVSDGSNYFII